MEQRLFGQEVSISIKATRRRTIAAASTVVAGQLKTFESQNEADPNAPKAQLMAQAFDQAALRVADLRGLKQLLLRTKGLVAHRGPLPATVEVSAGIAQAALSGEALAIARSEPDADGPPKAAPPNVLVAVVAAEATVASNLAEELLALEFDQAMEHATVEQLICVIAPAQGEVWLSPYWRERSGS